MMSTFGKLSENCDDHIGHCLRTVWNSIHLEEYRKEVPEFKSLELLYHILINDGGTVRLSSNILWKVFKINT